MAALEEEMFASGLPIAALMEKVGQAMAAWFRQQPGLLANGVVVLVGPGQFNLGIEGKILGVVWGVGNCEKIFAGV